MTNYYLLLASVLLLSFSPLQGQGHVPVFPELDGQDLLEAVQDNFTAASILSFSASRDSLFGRVYQEGDSLYCVYTDWSVYMPPGADPTQAAFQDGAGINTEHAWPRANGADLDPARADMHHLFPTRVDVNGDRGNLPFGEISDVLTDRWYYLDQQSSSVPASNRAAYSEYRQNVAFEPREAFKGNIARAMMYFYTIYRDEAVAAAPEFFNQQRTTLCQWHAQDPVDAIEWERTYRIAGHQDDKPNPLCSIVRWPLVCTVRNCKATIASPPRLLRTFMNWQHNSLQTPARGPVRCKLQPKKQVSCSLSIMTQADAVGKQSR